MHHRHYSTYMNHYPSSYIPPYTMIPELTTNTPNKTKTYPVYMSYQTPTTSYTSQQLNTFNTNNTFTQMTDTNSNLTDSYYFCRHCSTPYFRSHQCNQQKISQLNKQLQTLDMTLQYYENKIKEGITTKYNLLNQIESIQKEDSLKETNSQNNNLGENKSP